MRHLFRIAAVSVVANLTTIFPTSAACRTDNIEVRQADWHRLRITIKIVGEIFNRCTEATGAQLAFTFRDATGKLVGVRELWPASVRNVGPNETYPFEMSVPDYPSATSMTVRVLEAHRWD